MALCTRNTVEMTDIEYIPLINALKLNIMNNNLNEENTSLLLYRKQSSNSAQYIRNLTTVVNSCSIGVISMLIT